MKTEIDYAAVGRRVRAARLKKGLTQEELSNVVDISPSYASSIETGASKVALPTLIQIANALDTTTDSLLYDITTTLTNKYDADAREILDDCSAEEREFLLDIMRHAKEDFRKAVKKRK
jgi:transcriptional regulator with XRE-family HTH domain